jgi:hypothetical protein
MALTSNQAEQEEQRAKEAEERLEAEERARIAKRPRHQALHLSTLAEEHEPEELSTLSQAFETMVQIAKRAGDPEAFTFDDDKKESAVVSGLRESLQPLKIVSRAKVTQSRVYSAAYHPEVSKDLIFFGGMFSLGCSTFVVKRDSRQKWATGHLGCKSTSRGNC